jgi:Protein of unknown function (DUF1189)
VEQFPFWQAPYLAFFSQPFYRDVAQRWRGLSLTYLLLLLAVTWLPNVLRLNSKVENFRKNDLPPILEQVPKLEVLNGEVKADAKMPYRIIDPKTKETWVVIDTSASADDFDRLNTLILITKDSVIANQSTGVSSFSRNVNLKDLEGVVIEKESLRTFIDGIIRWTRTLAYPLLVINSWSYRFFQALLFGVLGMIIANTIQVRLPYATLVRLSVIGLTPVILIRTVLDFFGIALPLWWLVAFAITVVYLYQAIKANQGVEDGSH